MSRFPVQALEFLPKGKLTKYTNIGLVVDKLKISLTARQVAGLSQLLKKKLDNEEQLLQRDEGIEILASFENVRKCERLWHEMILYKVFYHEEI